MKFVFPRVQDNPENRAGQVSLASIVIRGSPPAPAPAPQGVQVLPPPTAAPAAGAHAAAHARAANPYLLRADDIKTKLNLRKLECIERTEYLQAQRFKVAVQKVEELQNALEQLELKKGAAILKEDYVVADTMKTSIAQI